MNYEYGTEVCWGDLVGAIDLQLETRKFNELKSVTVEIAQTLVQYGLESIDRAIATAKQPWYKPDLTGATSRANVRGHILWHKDTLAKTKGSATSPYSPGEDLKKWVLQAYIEDNAAEEGNAAMQAAWQAMWDEIEGKLASYSQAVVTAAQKVVQAGVGVASSAVEGVTGLPLWAWALIVGGSVALVGYGLAKSGVAKEVLVRRLGGR